MVNIFRLPIYNCSPDHILEKHLIAREKFVREFEATGWDKSRAIDIYNSWHRNQTDPDNYIVGYLYVDYCNGCFQYRLGFCRKSNSSKAYNMPLYTSTKHYMKVHHVNGVYDCPNNKNNAEIATMIKKSIDMICGNDIADLYCDRDAFNLLNRHIDYIALLADIK